MQKLTSVLPFVVTLLASNFSFSEEVAKVFEISGQQYVCMKPTAASEFLKIVKDLYPVTKAAFEQCNAVLDEYKTQVYTLEASVKTEKSISELQRSTIGNLTKENVEMNDYKENRFLFYSLFTAGGVVVGVSATLLVLYLVGELK